MPLTRVYLPLTPSDLDLLTEGGTLGPAPLAGHAVTPALGSPGLTTDEEELEYQAWVAATEEAAGTVADGVRRVVAAADVDSEAVTRPAQPEGPTRVQLTVPVEREQLVSFHVDEEPGATGTADLLWYDVTELDDVRALLAR